MLCGSHGRKHEGAPREAFAGSRSRCSSAQSFVVDPRGTIVGESYDLEGDPDRWVEDMQRALREAESSR